MGSSIGGAEALTAYSFGVMNIVKGGVALSTFITGGDTAGTQSALWAQRVRMQVDPAGGSVRYRYDGGVAVGGALAAGQILTGGETLILEGHQNIRNLVIASTQVTPGTLYVTAERL